MLLTYQYKSHEYRLFIQWTTADGKSVAFQDAIEQIVKRHEFPTGGWSEVAARLDLLTDKLYDQLYRFIDERASIPYNPLFRKMITRSMDEISSYIKTYATPDRQGEEALVSYLFTCIVDKLAEMVGIYLEEHAYQCKFRERYRLKEQYIETTPQSQLAFEFEDVLLQMTDISRQMDCLSEVQRSRLVKHIFLKHTTREIAFSENTTQQAVQKSITAAMKKLKAMLAIQ